MEFISSFFSTPLWHFFDNPLCKNQKIRFIRSTRENIKKRHRNIEKKIRLRLNVYQKNARALSFYQREGLDIQCEGLDDATGEKEYTML